MYYYVGVATSCSATPIRKWPRLTTTPTTPLPARAAPTVTPPAHVETPPTPTPRRSPHCSTARPTVLPVHRRPQLVHCALPNPCCCHFLVPVCFRLRRSRSHPYCRRFAPSSLPSHAIPCLGHRALLQCPTIAVPYQLAGSVNSSGTPSFGSCCSMLHG